MCGKVCVGLAVEFVREGFKELGVCGLSLGCRCGLRGSCRVGESVEDSGVVLDEDFCNGLCCSVVLIQAAECVFEVAVFHDSEG